MSNLLPQYAEQFDLSFWSDAKVNQDQVELELSESKKLNSNYINVNEARKLRAQMKKSATKFFLLNKILLNKQQKNL